MFNDKVKLKRTAAAALLVCLTVAIVCAAGSCAFDAGAKAEVTVVSKTPEAATPPAETPSALPAAEPTPVPTTTPTWYPQEVKKGAQGEDVKALKERLKQLGYYLSDEAMDTYGDKRTEDRDTLCAGLAETLKARQSKKSWLVYTLQGTAPAVCPVGVSFR